MTRVLKGPPHCPPCNRGQHNVYEYLGDAKVKLLRQRCRGKNCECRCRTHYMHNGRPVRIGKTPDHLTNALDRTHVDKTELEALRKRVFGDEDGDD